MKKLWKRTILWALLAALLLGMLPQVSLRAEAEAAGIVPGELVTLSAGQEATIETQGGTSYQTTNLVFESVGNTIASIVGYNESGDTVLDVFVCDDDYLEIFYNALGGYTFECKVLYGQLKINYNTANQGADGGDPVCTVYEFGEKLEWLVKPNISEVYLAVGDTAIMNVSQVTDGYSARAESYDYGYSGYNVATIDSSGKITARGVGTTTVYMNTLFWYSSTQYFYLTIPCTVHVVENYSLEAYRNLYYAAPGEKYFNIVAYNAAGYRVTGFDITVGDETYNTGSRTNALIDIPPEFDGSITISRDGYVPYVLENQYLAVNNVITMTPSSGTDPVLQALWVRPAGGADYVNAKFQTVQVTEGSGIIYEISYDAWWNGHGCSNVYLQQGTMTLSLSSEGDRYALGQYFTADGGPIYLHALTSDGYVITVPILINVSAEITIMEMDFGEEVSANIDDSVNGLGGQRVSYDLYRTVPIKFAVNNDGTVRGIIGLKFSGQSGSDEDLYSLYEEINQTVRCIKAADARGDTATSNSLMKNLNETVEERNAYIDNSGGSFGFKSTVSILGYMDGRMTTDGLDITEVGLIGIFEVSDGGYDIVFLGGLPFRWTWRFTDKAQLLITNLSDDSDGELKLRVPDFYNSISVSGELSSGVYGYVEAAATVTGSVNFAYPEQTRDFSDGTWTLNLNFHVGGKLGGAEVVEILDLTPIDNMQIYPLELASTTSAQTSPVLMADGEAEDSWDALGQSQTLRTLTSTDPAPQLFRLTDRDVLVWAENNASRPEADRSCLYYSVRSHETGSWTDPAPVADDGLADYTPKLMQVGDDLYLTWQKASGTLAEASQLQQTLSGLEVYTARFDTSTNTFVDAQMVHDTNETLDMLPQVQQVNGETTVYWVRCSDLAAPESNTAIYSASCSGDEGWTEQEVCKVPGIPDGLACTSDGTVYYTCNGVLYSVAGGAATAMTGEDAYARAPKLCQGTLYWLEDGYVTDGTVQIPASETAGDFALYAQESGTGSAVVFYDYDENGRQLFVTCGDTDGWGEPLAVTQYTDVLPSGLTGYYDADGSLVIAVSTVPDGTTVQEQAQLRLVTVEKRCDLEVTYADYLGTSLTDGGTLLTDVFLTNAGTTHMDSVLLTLAAGDTVLCSKSAAVDLYPGQSTSVEFLMPVEAALQEGAVLAVTPGKGSDADSTNNTVALELRTADISAEYMTLDTLPDGTVQVSALAINRGMTDLTGIKVLFNKGTPDGELIAELDAGDAAIGQTLHIQSSLTGLSEGDLVYMTLQMEGEENYLSNNTAFAMVGGVLQETSTASHLDDFNGQQLELDKDYTFRTGYDNQTGEREEAVGSFTPEESGFYLIRLEGYNRSDYYNLYCTVAPYADNQWVREEVTENDSGAWFAERILSVYLEAGTSYSVEAYSSNGTVMTVRLEKAPAAEQLQISDVTLPLEEAIGLYNLWNKGHIVFQPELSRDILTFRSSDETVARVEESCYMRGYAPGTVTVTATGRYTGLEDTFQITILEPELGTHLVLGQQTIEVEEAEFRSFTPPETGYYHFGIGEEFYFELLADGRSHFLQSDGCCAMLLQGGREYLCYFHESGSLNIQKVEPVDIALGDSVSCDCADCLDVMLYRYVPQEDTAGNLWFYGRSCDLKVYDGQYQLLYSESAGGGYYSSSENLAAVFESGKTYYIALEHNSASKLELTQLEMTLDYYSAVFVGDQVQLDPNLSYGSSDDMDLVWSSSDERIAEVNKVGFVTFQEAGEVTITVSAMEGLVSAEHTFHVIGTEPLLLDTPLEKTLDGSRVTAARLSFTPETDGDYVYTINYRAPEDTYWYYSWQLTDEDGNWLEPSTSGHTGDASVFSIHLEAGQACILTLFYESEAENSDIDLTFLVSHVDCDTTGHRYTISYGYPAGCTYSGLTDGEYCCACGQVRVAQQEIPALGHDYVNGVCTRCGEPDPDYVEPKPAISGVTRIFGDNRYLTSFGIANQLKETLGVEKFQTIIVAYGQNFPDALTGSYLAAVKDAPILLTENRKQSQVVDYISENLAAGGTVYILGGVNAIPSSFETALSAKGITAKRLAGDDRYQTNLKILEEAGVSADQEILICTGTGFADSLSASAAGLPILLVGKELKAEQKEFLKSTSGKFVIIGGTSAVSSTLEIELKALGSVSRLGGATRYETSVLVAQRFVQNPGAAILAYAKNFPDGLCGGPLAYALGAPLILTDTDHTDAANAYIENISSGIVVGGPGLISDSAVRNIFDLAANATITVK